MITPVARYKPSVMPVVGEHLLPLDPRARPRVFACCIVPPHAEHTALVLRCCYTRKAAERAIRQELRNADSLERFYIWDRTAVWNPHELACWTPVAEFPRDQWLPGLTENSVRRVRPPTVKCVHGVDAGFCTVCDP